MGGHAGFALGLALARPADQRRALRLRGRPADEPRHPADGRRAGARQLLPLHARQRVLRHHRRAAGAEREERGVRRDRARRRAIRARSPSTSSRTSRAASRPSWPSRARCSWRSRWCRRSRTSRSASGCAGRRARATACWRTCAPSWASRGNSPMDAMDAIDPVTLVVVQNGLQQVASEMDLTFERAAFSPVISEGFDRSDGIYSTRERRGHRPGRARAAHLRGRHAVHDARGHRPREGRARSRSSPATSSSSTIPTAAAPI